MPRAIEVVTSWHGTFGTAAGEGVTLFLRTHCGQRASTVVSHYHVQEAREDLWAWWTEHQRHCHHCRATEELRWLLYEGYVFEIGATRREAWVRTPAGNLYHPLWDGLHERWSCDCKAGSNGKLCKHVRALKSPVAALRAREAA